MDADPARRVLRAAVLVGLVTAPSCPGRDPAAKGVLLVTLDTTRADRLGCYGYERAETPVLDGLAKAAARFADATSEIPTTLGSHATMFTGQAPPQHGVRYNGMFRLNDASVTIAERLRDAGWATAAVPSAYPVVATSGIAQGFDVYEDMFTGPGAKDLPIDSERRADDVTRRGVEWIGKNGGKPFFLWLHYYDPHYPYEPPFPYSTKFRDRPYDGEIAHVDRQIGEVFAALRSRGLWDDTLVVVAGDHGEGLYEHDEKMHSHLVYQSTLRVPLLVKPPGRAASRVVHDPVSLADVGPTILDYAGLTASGFEGTSLRAAVRGGELPVRSLYFETLAGSLVYGWAPLDGLRRGRWKLIRSSPPELYDLETDPGETANQWEAQKEIASDLDAELTKRLAEWSAAGSTVAATEVPLDAAAMDRLASLGYIGGAVVESRQKGASPREKVHLEGVIFDARDRMMDRDYAGALASIRTVLAEDPANRYGLQIATTSAVHLERFDEAEAFAQQAIDRYPEYVPAQVARGELYVRRREYGKAAATFRAGLVASPGAPALTYRLALALLASGEVAEASRVVDGAIAEGKAEQPSFLVVRALCRARSGDEPGARAALSEAIAKGYRNRKVLETEPLLAPLRAVRGIDELLKSIPEAAKA